LDYLLGYIINPLYSVAAKWKTNQSINQKISCKAVDMMYCYINSKAHMPVIFLAQTHSNLEHNFRISAVTVGVPCNVNDEEDGFEVDVLKLPTE
jgi:hypothetical protein